MNKVIEIGHIATDIESKVTQSNVAWATFKIAVNRRFRSADGQRLADFLPVVVWRQTAEYVTKYGHKGDRIAVYGAVQTRSYEAQDGTKRYVTEINADEVELLGSRGEGSNSGNNSSGEQRTPNIMQQQGFVEVDDSESELPF